MTTEYSDGLATAVAKGGGRVLSYIWGDEDEILGFEEDGQLRFFLTDDLGSVRDVVDQNGDVIQSYEFNEFGIPMPGSGSGTETYSPKTWIGAFSVNDDTMDSGLYLMGLRHYAPELGRFLSRDPLGLAGSLNPYVYAENSPIDLIDPEGLKGRSARARARAAQRAATRRFNRARRRQLHANLDALGLKNLDLSGKTLTRGANALYRRGFVFEGAELSGGRPCPDLWTQGSSVYYHFRNPTTGVKVIWDSGNMGGLYPNTQRPHWTIRKGNAYYNHRGESVPQHSGPAHIRSGGYGEQFYEVREQGVLPKGFPDPPLGNDGFIEIGPAQGPIEL